MSSQATSIEVAIAVSKYLRRVRARQSPHTLKNRRIAAAQFDEWCRRNGSSLFEADEWLVEDWIDYMLDDEGGEGFAPRTVRNKIYDISALYQYLKKRNHVDENPVEDVDTSDLTGTIMDEYAEVRYLEPEEYEAMLDACSRVRDELLLRLLWNCGVRAEEAVNIEVEAHLDRDKREITIKTGKQGRTSDVKSRTVYYSRRMERTLRDWLDRGARNKYMSSDSSSHLIVSKQADHPQPKRVTEIIDEIATDAGVQDELWEDASGRKRYRVTAHSFRHSYAVHRVKQGMPIVYLQELMGHADIEQTRKYLKFRKDDIREAEKKYAPRI
ncbi:tyrosine-type recombinase/integrase [Halobacterium yunchengense]|uniref:tyrosine-type recombinase/integrase n=1 Tax=Halobacterium yunchengense TaxID=3108497 RepID=UPI00300B8C3B